MKTFTKPKSNILDYFYPGYEPRTTQLKVLPQIEAGWNRFDVAVIRADVGAGKSLLADCIARYAWEKHGMKSSIIMPNNPLVGQYTAAFPHMTTIGHRGSYGSPSSWETAKQEYKRATTKVGNYYTYLSHRAYSDVLIIDESHKLIDTLLDFDTIKIWKHLTPFPHFTNVLDVMMWAHDNQDVDKKIKKLYQTLQRKPTEYTIKLDVEDYRGKEQEVLKILPLTPRNLKPFFWPYSVRKIIMMSATIGSEDVYEFGLEKRRQLSIDGGSPIPKEHRPIIYDPVGNMSYRHQDSNMKALMGRIQLYAERHGGTKGLVHTTYSMARIMRKHIPAALKDKLMFHNNTNKSRVLQDYLTSDPKEGKILVGCGLTEGLDLKDDLCRWQVISKIMFPNKSDLAVAEKMKQHPEWYVWQAIRDLEQARGRVVRTPDDFGITYIVDAAFERLYSDNIDMFSQPFREALQ